MTIRLQHYWQQLKESLWFVPGLIVLGSFGVAYALIEFDSNTSFNGAKRFPLLFGAGAEGSRGMLTAIAGSMLTVAALVFSLTLSTITQVSSQYSPRVLRNFMRDRGNQFVMGYFVGVFAYCLIVLGTIRGTDEQKFVPSTAVLVGLVLALGGVAALIFFIHHIAESLQTGTILRNISSETTKAIDDLFPSDAEEPDETPERVEAAWNEASEQTDWLPVWSTTTGYVQTIDLGGLLDWAKEHKVVVRLEQQVGAFVGENALLVSVRSDKNQLDFPENKAPRSLTKLIVIGRNRSIGQDVAFGMQQLVDIALKALSPGINDTTTAIMAVDYLGIISGRLAGRNFPPRLRFDDHDLRILVRIADFESYVRLAFDLVRINAKGNHAVLRRLLRALALAGDYALTDDRKQVLSKQASLLIATAEQTLITDYEKREVRSLYDELKPAWS